MNVDVRITETFSYKNRGRKFSSFIYTEWQKATRDVKTQAKDLAPHNKMKLSQAIYGRTYQEPIKAVVGIAPVFGPTGFNYAPFVANQLDIQTEGDTRYFMGGQTISYGKPAYSPAGNKIRWSSSTGWWQFIEKESKRTFLNASRRGAAKYAKEMNA